MNFCKNLKLFAFILLLTSGIFAAPGDLDPTFGPVGFVITPFPGEGVTNHTILRQPDGKIILVGEREGGPTPGGITLVRYNADGTLDQSFDGDGIVRSNFLGVGNAAVLQPDGKIVVTGRTGDLQGTYFTVIRYNSDGTLDSTFSNDGIFTLPVLITGNAIAIQPDGKIVVAGTVITPPSDDFAVVRLNADGTLDTTFSDDGKVFTAVGDSSVNSGDDIVKSLVIQADGKIVVGGISPFVGTERDFALVRYNADGTLDSTFDGDGILHTSFNNSAQNEYLQAITIDANGRIVAVGYLVDMAVQEWSFAVVRYNSDGSLDSSFSGDGKLLFKTRPLIYEQANAVVIQPDSKILLAGLSGFSVQDFALVRLNSDGTLDSTFGTNGAVYTRVSEQINAAFVSVTLAPNGDIFAGGNFFAFAKYNRNGVPAPEFGRFGYVTNRFQISDFFDPLFFEAKSVALQSNGKFVVAGNYLTNTNNTNGIVARYDANGSLDRSFNNQAGFTVINEPTANSRELNSVALQSDGKILVVGTYERDDDAGLFISRYKVDGSKDTQFGNNGQVQISVLEGGALGQDIAVLPDGKIVVAGATANIFTQLVKFAVFKLNADGSRDTSFGTNGVAATSISSSNDVALSIAVQTDGKIIAAGASNFNEGGNSQIALARFNANGSIDNSFGAGGKVTTEVGAFVDTAADVKLQTDGKIVIGGVSCADGNCDGGNGLIFRYNANGSLDSTFDGDGKIFTQPTTSGSPTAISSIAIQPDNKIVGGGAVINPITQSDALIVRYNANGSPDSTFGTNGIVSADINNSEQIAYSIALKPDGKIISVGSSSNGTRTDFAVWSFLGSEDTTFIPNAKTPFDFDGDRKTDVSIFRPESGQWWYLRSSDSSSRAFTFGISTDKLVPADFTGDGKTDIAFWRESTGEWFILRSEDGSFYSFPFGGNGDIPAPADYDSDGKADPAVFRPSNATWYILNSGGGTRIQQFGIAGDKPVVADYDGDGKADLAIFRPSNGQWWINRSTTQTTSVFSFGTNTDRTVPADYTGDGKADVAFYRPSSGEWFVLRSENASFYSFPFGASGDVPAPGDYDGDGKSDAAIFRPSNNTWYKSQLASGFEAITFGINNDVPLPSVFVR